MSDDLRTRMHHVADEVTPLPVSDDLWRRGQAARRRAQALAVAAAAWSSGLCRRRRRALVRAGPGGAYGVGRGADGGAIPSRIEDVPATSSRPARPRRRAGVGGVRLAHSGEPVVIAAPTAGAPARPGGTRPRRWTSSRLSARRPRRRVPRGATCGRRTPSTCAGRHWQTSSAAMPSTPTVARTLVTSGRRRQHARRTGIATVERVRSPAASLRPAGRVAAGRRAALPYARRPCTRTASSVAARPRATTVDGRRRSLRRRRPARRHARLPADSRTRVGRRRSDPLGWAEDELGRGAGSTRLPGRDVEGRHLAI